MLFGDGPQDLSHPRRRLGQLQLAGVQLGEGQEVAQQGVQSRRRLQYGADDLLLAGIEAPPLQRLGQAQHPVQGGADLVAEVGQEVALGLAGGFGAAQRQPQRLGLLLHLGDVDPEPDHPAIGGRALLDHQPAAVGDALLVAHARILHQRHALADPRLLAADGIGIIPPRHPDPERVLQPAPGREQIGRAVVDFGVALVPEDVAAFAVEEDNALGQGVDGLAQPPLGAAGVALGAFQGVLVPSPQEGDHGRQAALQPPGRPSRPHYSPTHSPISTHARPDTAPIG